MSKPMDDAKINALASILIKLGASYRAGVSVKQIIDIMEADPDDYPMSTHWVRKYIVSDEVAAHGIIRSARMRQPFEYYYDTARAAHNEAKQEIMNSTNVSEELAAVLANIQGSLERIEKRETSAGTNAKYPKHVYYAIKFMENTSEERALELLAMPKPSELGVTDEQWKACVGSILRQGKSKIGGKRKSD